VTARSEPGFEARLVLGEVERRDTYFLKTELATERFDLGSKSRELDVGQLGHGAGTGMEVDRKYNPPMQGPSEHLPVAVYSTSQVRELDRRAIELHGIPGYELMCRAGAAALDVLEASWPNARRVLVYCGAGNNAGDGYVVARLARASGLHAEVVAVVPTEGLKGDALRAAADCRAAGVPIQPFHADPANGAKFDVLVDALLGTGAARTLDGDFAAAVAAIGAARKPVLALDVPSGLHADTGLPLGAAVHADVTVTFVGLKQGLFLGNASDYAGRLEFAGLGIPAEAADGMAPALERLTGADLDRALPKRLRSAHKGTNGTLLIVAGGPGMPGAARLAAEAALRTGAGLVHVAAHASSLAAVLAGRAEVIGHAADVPADLDHLLETADGAVLGPGLGKSGWARALWRRVLDSNLPLIVDADGLNLLAEHPEARGRWVLTPHPAEAARLLGSTTVEVQRDRRTAALEIARRFAAVTVLKGACSLVAVDEAVTVCDRGNPGMATAGMGDVLSGVLGALCVQTRNLTASARAGVLLHALAGDSAAGSEERGTIASDLLPQLRRWANRS
jgi:NAD(P)H-hydrate epimerase